MLRGTAPYEPPRIHVRESGAPSPLSKGLPTQANLVPFSSMLRLVLSSLFAVAAISASGAELSFRFDDFPLNETPPGFRSAVSGQGTLGAWKIVRDDVPSLIAPLTPNAPAEPKRQVLGQVSGDITDERYPLLIFEGETFGDFTFTTRFKLVSGAIEQMAGIAFRLQDENNYYYVRASGLGSTFRFFKVVQGQRSQPIGPEMPIARGVWHDLSIECGGNQIRLFLNGKQVIPAITDTSFRSGKIAFWTKSDSVSHFVDSKIVYTPKEGLAEKLLRDVRQQYPRLVALKIYTIPLGSAQPRLIATTEDEKLGRAGGGIELDVITRDSVYHGKQKRVATVTMPLHDRNGDTIAAVQLKLDSFRGQTQQNAIARATPIIKYMEQRVRSSEDLLD